ncbi:MAG: hypothetical protein SH818_15625 [Saprospiraceae bacterium]|nr:hypothetical protein [Saprospiraceae bacterium]
MENHQASLPLHEWIKTSFEAKASIENNSVVVWHEDILKPLDVRYAWADNPFGANLTIKRGCRHPRSERINDT